MGPRPGGKAGGVVLGQDRNLAATTQPRVYRDLVGICVHVQRAVEAFFHRHRPAHACGWHRVTVARVRNQSLAQHASRSYVAIIPAARRALAAIDRARDADGIVDPLILEKNLSAIKYIIRGSENRYDPRLRATFYETVESALDLEAPAFRQLAAKVDLIFQNKRIPS